MNCQWCGRPLNDDFGYSETGETICSSYSIYNRVYSACKARSHRLRQKIAKQELKAAVANPDASQGQSALIEALQIIITQNDELIALQRQNQGTVKVTAKTTITEKTFEAPSFDDIDLDLLDVKGATGGNANETFTNRLLSIVDTKEKRVQ